MNNRIRFDQIETLIPAEIGIYEIHSDMGIALKVGISDNIQKDLKIIAHLVKVVCT